MKAFFSNTNLFTKQIKSNKFFKFNNMNFFLNNKIPSIYPQNKNKFSFQKIKTNNFSFISKKSSLLNIPKTSILKKSFSEKTQLKDEYQKFVSNKEENFNKISKSIENLISEVQNRNEENIFKILKELNSFPIRYSEFTELKELILNNIQNIPMTTASNLIEFITFFDKFDLENYEEYFSKILDKYTNKLNYFNSEELVVVMYCFSKFRISDDGIWGKLLKIIQSQVNTLKTNSLSKLFLGLSMLKTSQPNLFSNDSTNNIFSEIIFYLNKNSAEINQHDVFRTGISLTKKPLPLSEVPENLWLNMEKVFIENLPDYDLYQISQILLLFCETNFINEKLFTAIETEIINSYFERIDDLIKLPDNQLNLSSLLEDLCKINFSFALTIRGSLIFWNSFLKSCLKLKKYISVNSIESLNFIIYRSIDYFGRQFSHDTLNKNILEECYKNLEELNLLLEKKIIDENFLEVNELDPFNLMMPYSRMANNNYKIWNYITKNIMNVLSNPQFQMNPFLLSDITYAFSSYNSSLLNENQISLESTGKDSENYANSLYIQNMQKLWDIIEGHIVTTSKYLDVPYITNMIVDLSQINLDLKKSWGLLSVQVRENLEKGNFDFDNFILVLVGLKKRNYQDKNLWSDIEKFLSDNIVKINIEQLKKITVALVKANDTESQGIYSLIANRFCDQDILDQYNFENFVDLQIPFALIGIGNDKIWNKFEEILFKNFDHLKENKPLLLSTIYSFSRLGKGSSLIWNKFCVILTEKISDMDVDDLGHLGICLRDNIIKKFNLTKILNEDFWNKYLNIVDKNINNASLITCNNLLLIFNENDIIKSNTKIIKKIQDRIKALENI